MFLHPNALFTSHVAAGASGQGPSWRIWRHMGSNPAPDGSNPWIYFFDDFEGANVLAASGYFGKGPYYGYLDTSCSIAKLATDLGGVIQLATHTTADDDCSFTLDNVSGLVKIATGSPGVVTDKGAKLLFEARIRMPSVTDGAGSAFVGLCEPGLVANNGFVTDSHALAANDMLGFYILDADNDAVNFGYNVTGGTAQVVGTTAISLATFVNLGFVYDPEKPSSMRMPWYVNGVEQATYVTGAVIGEKVGNAGSATFPAGLHMSPAADAKTDGSAAFKMDIDWWGFAMQRLG